MMTPQDRAEARAEAAGQTYHYFCRDGMCGASDCGICRNGAAPWEEDGDDDVDGDGVESTWATTYHIARSDFAGGIRAGDLYSRTTGFDYIEGGERIGYHKALKRLVSRPLGAENHKPKAWAVAMRARASQLQQRRAQRVLRQYR